VDFFAATPALSRRLRNPSRKRASLPAPSGSRPPRSPAARRSGCKIAAELAARATGDMLNLLDEPTTGLHLDDVKKLLLVLHRLVDAGNTVVLVEHP